GQSRRARGLETLGAARLHHATADSRGGASPGPDVRGRGARASRVERQRPACARRRAWAPRGRPAAGAPAARGVRPYPARRARRGDRVVEALRRREPDAHLQAWWRRVLVVARSTEGPPVLPARAGEA